jgi:hypothetical protein
MGGLMVLEAQFEPKKQGEDKEMRSNQALRTIRMTSLKSPNLCQKNLKTRESKKRVKKN